MDHKWSDLRRSIMRGVVSWQRDRDEHLGSHGSSEVILSRPLLGDSKAKSR